MSMSTPGAADPGFRPVAGARQRVKERWWAVQPPRVDTPRLTSRRAYGEVVVVFGAFFAASIASAAFRVAGDAPSATVIGWAQAIPASISQITTAVLCVLVPVLLVRRRGLGPSDLGLTKPGTVGLSQGIRIAAWALLALIAGGIVTSMLATGRFPGAFSYPSLTFYLFHAAQAGILEEVVVLAFVVATLEQARRPRPEIIAVALVLRASFHIYYGPGALGIFVWASVFLWLYLRFRTIVPLIIVHSSWDVLITLARRWPLVGGLAVLGLLALLITALILWLVFRGTRTSNDAGYGPMPPGWYGDPAGTTGFRWFDGRTWTPLATPTRAHRITMPDAADAADSADRPT